MTTSFFASGLAGFLMGASLIVAIGVQNAYVLRQGIRKEHIGKVIAICAVSDAILILVGVVSVGALTNLHPAALDVMRYGGAAYLAWFGIRSLLAARRAGGLKAGSAPAAAGSVVITALALTWLNPHVYLDTVFMLGSIANQHGPDGRWVFAGGAVAASIIWFSALGLGARALADRLAHPRTWQVIDVLVGIMMLGIAGMLIVKG